MPSIIFREAQGGPIPRQENELNFQGGGGTPAGTQFHNILIFADKASTGTATADTIAGPYSLDEIIDGGGVNSPMASMAATIFEFNSPKTGRIRGQVWILPVDEKALNTAAEQDLTFATNATGAGVWIFAVGGHEIRVSVYDGMTVTDQASAFVDAYNALPQSKRPPINVASAAGVVTLTASVKGEYTNDIGLRTVQDPGVGTTATWEGAYMGDTSGTGTKGVGSQAGELTAALAALAGFEDASIVVTPWAVADLPADAATTMGQIMAQVNADADAINQIPRYLIGGFDEDVTDAVAMAAAIDASDTAQRVMLPTIEGTDTWGGELAATQASMLSSEQHIGRSLDGLEASNIWPPTTTDRYTDGDLLTLLSNGLTPWMVHTGRTYPGCVRALMVRSEFGPKDFHNVRVADWVRWRYYALTQERLDRVSIVEDDAVPPDAPHVTTPAAVASLLREVLSEAERLGYITQVESLWEKFQNELNDTELRQATPLEPVAQLHNLMTRYDVQLSG
jgi:phage tail sheath gpL-like